MAGHADMLQLRPPVVVVLRLYLKPDGNVEKVEIVKSSGSINIDQPTRIAAYKWWFEPAKDSLGRPRGDVIEFTCRFV
jgi:TonB family protein